MKVLEILAIILAVRYLITIGIMIWYAYIHKYSYTKSLKTYRKDGLIITLFPMFYLVLIMIGYIKFLKEKN